MEEGVGGFLGLLALLAVILTILWIVLPFYIISMNDKLKALIAEQRDTNKHLKTLITAAKNQAMADKLQTPRKPQEPAISPSSLAD